MRYNTKSGWIALSIAMIGDLLFSSILAVFYESYDSTMLSISALGVHDSPVRIPFNIWMFIEGVLFLYAIPAIYQAFSRISRRLTITLSIFIAIFAIGACIMTTFFSVDESDGAETMAYKIHGAGSVSGFILLLFAPLILAIMFRRIKDKVANITLIIAFFIAFTLFTLFVMSDKPEFEGTIVARQGIWQRMYLIVVYISIGYGAFRNRTKIA